MNIWTGKYFSLSELTGPRETSPEVRVSLLHLVTTVLDPWREVVGSAMRVTSGYRTREENARLPGAAPDSWHMWGGAVDIAPMVVELGYAWSCLESLPYDKAILYGTHIHVQANSGANRRWRYRATRNADGKVRYARL